MATHPSILAWEMPWTEERGGLQTMGLQRVKPNLVTKQQQTPLYTLYIIILRLSNHIDVVGG